MTKEDKMNNLRNYINELNAEAYNFDFDFRALTEDEAKELNIDNGAYWLADMNEVYNYDFSYENYCMMCELADEFGFDKPTDCNDSIFDNFRNIIEEDGEGGIDWYDYVMILFRF